jgi:hypothetical protein
MKTTEYTTEVQQLTNGAWVVQRVYGDVFALDGSYRVERVSVQFRTRREAVKS